MDARLAKTIGSAAREARLARELTQEDAADLVGVSVEFYARIERGKTLPSVPTLLRLATALHVSADALLGLARVPPSTRDRPIVAAPRGAVPRKLARRLSRARPSTLRLVNLLLREVEEAG